MFGIKRIILIKLFLSLSFLPSVYAVDSSKASINNADRIYQSIFLPLLLGTKECPNIKFDLWINYLGASRAEILENRINRQSLAESIGVPYVKEDFDYEKFDEDFEKFLSNKKTDDPSKIKDCQKFTSTIIGLKYMDTIDSKMSAEIDELISSLQAAKEAAKKTNDFNVTIKKVMKKSCDGMSDAVIDIRDGMTGIIKRCFDKYIGEYSVEALNKFACEHYSSQICQILKVKKK